MLVLPISGTEKNLMKQPGSSLLTHRNLNGHEISQKSTKASQGCHFRELLAIQTFNDIINIILGCLSVQSHQQFQAFCFTASRYNSQVLIWVDPVTMYVLLPINIMREFASAGKNCSSLQT